jgi:hypothetical protein
MKTEPLATLRMKDSSRERAYNHQRKSKASKISFQGNVFFFQDNNIDKRKQREANLHGFIMRASAHIVT